MNLHFKERVKPWLDLIQVFLTITAFLAAGWWFRAQGQTRPRLKIEQQVSSRRVSKNQQMLIVDIKLSNVGNIPLDLKYGKVKVYELFPEDKFVEEQDAATKDSVLRLEPGEDDQVYEEFRQLDGNASAVRVYSFFQNPDVKEMGWDATTFCSLDNGKAK